jgi:hypothetical protein
MKNMIKRKSWLLVLLLLFIFVTDSSALHFRIDRGKTRIKLLPGWSDGGVIKVENVSTDPVDIKVYSGDWIYSDQDGSKEFLPVNTDPKSCANWLKFYPTFFTIPPRSMQTVNFVIAIPSDAVGGHYAVLFFEAEGGTNVDASTGSVVRVYNRIASLFYVEPEGTIIRKVNISDVNIGKKNNTVEIKANFSNDGNVDVNTKGLYDLIDGQGMVFARGEFNEVFTMAGDKAKLSGKSEVNDLPSGEYDLILTFNLEEEILVKEYKVNVDSSGNINSVKEIN